MSNNIDWSDIETAAKELAGNWRQFICFAWHRGYDLEDADQWAIVYTSGRDAGLLSQSNHAEIVKLLAPFTKGDDPDVVFESHSHWAVGHVDGFSVRVFGNNGEITEAFTEFCRIKERLDDYPVFNESDYSEREYEATLENYRSEMWAVRKELPEGGSARSTPGSATTAKTSSSKIETTKAVGHRRTKSPRRCKTLACCRAWLLSARE
jgi:hypothetical protein